MKDAGGGGPKTFSRNQERGGRNGGLSRHGGALPCSHCKDDVVKFLKSYSHSRPRSSKGRRAAAKNCSRYAWSRNGVSQNPSGGGSPHGSRPCWPVKEVWSLPMHSSMMPVRSTGNVSSVSGVVSGILASRSPTPIKIRPTTRTGAKMFLCFVHHPRRCRLTNVLADAPSSRAKVFTGDSI